MKAFIFVALAALLLVQFTDALPRPKRALRFRRATLRLPRSANFESTEDMTEHEKILMFGVNELLDFGKTTVEKHQKFFNKVVREAEKSNLNLNKELRELRDFSQAVDELDNEASAEYFEKVFELFSKATDITDKYDLDEIKNPTDTQKTMSRLFDENGLMILQLECLARIGLMRQHFTTRFQSYVNSLTPAEKRKQRKFVQWFNKFKNEDDFQNSMEIMFEFFDFLE